MTKRLTLEQIAEVERLHAPPSRWAYEEAGERDTEISAHVRALCAEAREERLTISYRGRLAAGVLVLSASTPPLALSFCRHNETVGIPCGKVSAGETPEQAAVRETKEETGLDVELDLVHPPYVGFDVSGYLVFAYRAKIVGGTQFEEMKEGRPSWGSFQALCEGQYKIYNRRLLHHFGIGYDGLSWQPPDVKIDPSWDPWRAR